MTGMELRDFRKSLLLSQEEFGNELGMKSPQVQISQLERGVRPLTGRVLKSIDRWKENMKLKKEIARRKI